jgi:MFS family permease
MDPPGRTEGPQRISIAVVTSVVALQIAVTVPMFLVSTLSPYLRDDVGLTERSLGLGVGAFYVVSAASAVWLGRIADRQSWRRGLLIASVAVLVQMLLLARFVNSSVLLIVVLAGTALAHSLAVGSMNLAILESVPRSRQGIVFGIKQAAVPGATMLAGLSAPLIAAQIGWRWAFVIVAAFPTTAVALAFARRTGRVAANGAGNVAAPVPAELVKRLRALSLAFAIGTFSTSSLGAFFVLYAVDRGLRPTTAGVVVAVASGVNITVRILMGWLADRRDWDAFGVAGLLMFGGAAGYLLLAFGNGWVLVLGAVLGYGIGWAWQGLVHLGAVRLLPSAPGYATGVIRTGLATGSGTGPVVSGLLIGVLGYTSLWCLLGGLAVVAAVVVFLTVRRTSPSGPAVRTPAEESLG